RRVRPGGRGHRGRFRAGGGGARDARQGLRGVAGDRRGRDPHGRRRRRCRGDGRTMTGGRTVAEQRHRRETRYMAAVAVLLALGALAVWAASRMDWVGYTYENGLQPAVDGSFDGGTWASELTPLALLLLAGIAAMFAVRGWAQRLVGLVVA